MKQTFEEWLQSVGAKPEHGMINVGCCGRFCFTPWAVTEYAGNIAITHQNVPDFERIVDELKRATSVLNSYIEWRRQHESE